jgi:hypothetical protein
VLTISRLSRWSINYYNDTANQAQAAAMDRQAAGGGLGEYYSESDTRVPTWVVAGDAAAVGELTGLDGASLHGGFVDTKVCSRLAAKTTPPVFSTRPVKPADPRLHLGPPRDHTSCAVANDLRVRKRQSPRPDRENRW